MGDKIPLAVITIDPPLTLDDVKDGPELRTIELIHLKVDGNRFLGLPWDANAIDARDSGMNYYPHFIADEIQQVLDYYTDREFTGFIEVRNSSPSSAPIFRYYVLGRQVETASPTLSWPDEQDGSTARIAELERELLVLRGTELNPSPTILDAQSYRKLADELSATMTDDWDGEDAEPYILTQYVRWLAAGQPRDEDGYPVRRETYPAAKTEQQAGPRKSVDIGTGMPATTHLEAFGQCLRDAFGTIPYHVGSSIHGKTWRDVDVRLMLDDDRFDALFPGYADYRQGDAWWALACSAISELGRQRTGLPIDFQIQKTTEANEQFPGARNPLFVGHAKDDHRPTMQAARDADGSAS
jgi:hypothetical protein